MSSNAGTQQGQSKPRPIERKQHVRSDREGSGKVHEGARRKSTGSQRPPENSPRTRGSPQSVPTHNRTPPERGRNQGAGGSSSAGPSSRSGSLGRSPQNQGGVGPGQVGLGKSPPVRGTPARRGSKKGHRLTADDWDDADEEIRDYFAGHGHQSRGPSARRGRWEQYHEELELEMALALSLSVDNAPENGPPRVPGTARAHELSYERLTTLEDVKVTATADAVASLPSATFSGSMHSSPLKATTTSAGHEMCTICQHEYGAGDDLVVLPCGHRLHPHCGSEWLLNYSRRCPVCKVDISEDVS